MMQQKCIDKSRSAAFYKRLHIFLKAVVVTLISLTICACTIKAKGYNFDTGQVITATFKYSGSGRGPIDATLPSGETCKGEYVTLPSGSTGWGSIFAMLYGPIGAATTAIGTSKNSTDNTQKGTAVVTCEQGTVVECEYVAGTGTFGPRGYGACKDNKGNNYKLMF
jgi:hypothetical protein